jgi:hypothetical protein
LALEPVVVPNEELPAGVMPSGQVLEPEENCPP